MAKKTHWKEWTEREYLGSWEFGPEEVKTFTIDKIVRKEVVGNGGKKTTETVAMLKNSKPMVLNSINQSTIESIAGTPYIEDWAGVEIDIKVDHNVKFAGELVGGLRVVYKKQAPKKQELITLQAGTKYYDKVVGYISDPAQKSKEWGSILKVLKTKYKMSPTMASGLKKIHAGDE